ncbi:MAG: acid shock protein, partial [Oscillospiraceae bacterium]|nr:acid shock protein [Oscillospiraceae bacterium]
MKKVLSVLLAAAMVMGMSVSAFAADEDAGYKVYGSGSGTNTAKVDTDITFSNYIHVVDENNNYVDTFHKDDAIDGIDEGDKLY